MTPLVHCILELVMLVRLSIASVAGLNVRAIEGLWGHCVCVTQCWQCIEASVLPNWVCLLPCLFVLCIMPFQALEVFKLSLCLFCLYFLLLVQLLKLQLRIHPKSFQVWFKSSNMLLQRHFCCNCIRCFAEHYRTTLQGYTGFRSYRVLCCDIAAGSWLAATSIPPHSSLDEEERLKATAAAACSAGL